jgi:type VII secretion integral membrane protein EccD
VPTAYSRVTLVNGSRRVDLALPAGLPLADVMPQLLRYCAPEERPEDPALWTVGRIGGPNLPLAQSLLDASIGDGEVLELRQSAVATHPAYVEDVRDAVEDAVDESGRQWRSTTSVQFALVVGAVVLGAAALLPAAQSATGSALALAAVIATVGVLAGWWAAQSGHRLAAQAVIVTAGTWGWLAGFLAADTAALAKPAAIGAGAVGALGVAAFARALTPLATAHLAAGALLGAAGVLLGAVTIAGWDYLNAVRIDGVLAVLVVGVLPRVSLTLGGLASADYRVRTFGLVDAADLADRIRQSTALLYGAIGAVAAIGSATALVLTFSGDVWDRILGTAIGLGLLLRSRAFSRIPHVLPLRTAGVAVLVGQGLWVIREYPEGSFAVAGVAAAVTAIVALSAVRLSDVARARLKQMLNLAETFVVIATIAIIGGALGIYDRVAELTR